MHGKGYKSESSVYTSGMIAGAAGKATKQPCKIHKQMFPTLVWMLKLKMKS